MIGKRALIIKTGCLSCRARGVRCRPDEPTCQRNSSACWGANGLAKDRSHGGYSNRFNGSSSVMSMNATWEGTRGERRSLHFFRVLTAPELAGWFDGSFWQVGLLQATTQDVAIKHLVAAIGALHEYQLRRQVSRLNGETESLHAFALRQCNRAIKHLMTPSTQSQKADLLRTLTAAVLLACLETMDQKREAAVPHIVYARRLSQQYSSSHLVTRLSRVPPYPTEPSHMEPLIAHYEVQLGDYTSDTVPPDVLGVLDLAQPLSFEHLAAARMPLERAIADLGNVIYTMQSQDDPHSLAFVEEKKLLYRDWLIHWDLAFTRYLDSNGSVIDRETLNASRLLKAHQLAATVLASLDHRLGEHAWAHFTKQFKAIVDLVSEMLTSLPRRSMTSQVPRTAYFSTGVGITEPLYCAASRCADHTVANRARVLLRRLPENEGAHSPWRISFIESILCAATGQQVVKPAAQDDVVRTAVDGKSGTED